MHYVMISTGKNESVDTIEIRQFDDLDDAFALIQSVNCNYSREDKYWTHSNIIQINQIIELDREKL